MSPPPLPPLFPPSTPPPSPPPPAPPPPSTPPSPPPPSPPLPAPPPYAPPPPAAPPPQAPTQEYIVSFSFSFDSSGRRLFEATGRRVSEVEAAFESIITLAVVQILKDNGLSVAPDKISVEVNKAEGLATVTTRFPTAAQTNSAVTLVGAVDDKNTTSAPSFWTSLGDKMAGFAIVQVGEVQQTLVSFDPPALPATAPPPPPVTMELEGALSLEEEELEGGAIAGIAVGSVVGMALLGAAVYLVRNKRRYNKANENMLNEITRGDEAATLERGQSEVGAGTSGSEVAPASVTPAATSLDGGVHFALR